MWLKTSRSKLISSTVSRGGRPLTIWLITVSYTHLDVYKRQIQRSLTKALARHGLGLYIYAGEDLPEIDKSKELEKRQNEQMIKWSEYRLSLIHI